MKQQADTRKSILNDLANQIHYVSEVTDTKTEIEILKIKNKLLQQLDKKKLNQEVIENQIWTNEKYFK